MSAGAFDTDIVLDGDRVHARQHAASVSVGRSTSPKLLWALTGSWVTGGEIEERDVKSGAAVAVTIATLASYETPRRPFVAVTGSAGASRVRALADDGTVRTWGAGDVRVGVTAGKTFGVAVPYLAARAFGGPVTWHREGGPVAGGDANHYTLGGGLTMRLPGSLDLTLEAMPLGERSASAGLTLHR